MIKIYKIISSSNLQAIYIGKTRETLIERLRKHRCEAERNPNIKVYQWLDDTCSIELIENYFGDNSGEREMEIINQYIAEGYEVMNTYINSTKLDGEYYIKMNKKHNIRRNPEYINWANIICQKAKKEGLTSKEYRKKYNIPEYSGQKTKI